MSDEQKPTSNNDETRPNQTFNFNGEIKAGNFNTGNQTFHGDVNFEYREGQTTNAEVRQQIAALMNELLSIVETEVKPENPEAAAEIKIAAKKATEEAEQENPKKGRLEIRGDDLMQAAKNIAAVAPLVTEIVRTLLMLR